MRTFPRVEPCPWTRTQYEMSSRVRVLDARTQQLLHASAALPSVSALALSLLRRALERHARSIQLSIELGTPAGATLSCDDDGVAFTDGEELRQALMYDSNAPGGGGTLPLLASVVRALDLRSTSASKSCEALVKDGELEHVREGSSRKYLKGNRIVLKDLFYQVRCCCEAVVMTLTSRAVASATACAHRRWRETPGLARSRERHLCVRARVPQGRFHSHGQVSGADRGPCRAAFTSWHLGPLSPASWETACWHRCAAAARCRA